MLRVNKHAEYEENSTAWANYKCHIQAKSQMLKSFWKEILVKKDRQVQMKFVGQVTEVAKCVQEMRQNPRALG